MGRRVEKNEYFGHISLFQFMKGTKAGELKKLLCVLDEFHRGKYGKEKK